MISGFLTSVISSLKPRQHIGNALRWLLISTIFYSGFFSSEAFDKRTNRVSTDVAISLRSLYKRVLLSPAKSRVTNELGDNGIHRCVDYCFVNAPPLYLPRRYAIANARIAPMPCSFAARMAANRSCFPGIFISSPPIRGFALFN